MGQYISKYKTSKQDGTINKTYKTGKNKHKTHKINI